jgi:hypothetical protein
LLGEAAWISAQRDAGRRVALARGATVIRCRDAKTFMNATDTCAREPGAPLDSTGREESSRSVSRSAPNGVSLDSAANRGKVSGVGMGGTPCARARAGDYRRDHHAITSPTTAW